MNLLVSICLILGLIIIYAILIQIYTVIFRITGMTNEKSRFQVISMLTGAGFTTSESEIVVQDKTRRRIAMAAMITGYAFSVVIVSLIMNMLMNFNKDEINDTALYIGIAFGVFVLFFIIFRIPIVHKLMDKIIEFFATKLLTRGKNDNVITLLDNYGKDAIAEVFIRNLPQFMEHKNMIECNLKNEYQMNVLMVKRNGRVIDVTKDTIIQNGDSVVIFGDLQNIKNVFHHADKESKEIEAVEDNKLNKIEIIDNFGNDAMVSIELYNIPEFMVGKKMKENSLKDKFMINVVMISRDKKIINVTANTIIEAYDEIVVFGPYKNIKAVFIDMVDFENEDNK